MSQTDLHPARTAPEAPRRRTALVVGLVLALLASATVAGAAWWRARSDSDLLAAVAAAPPGTERLSWVDWAAVRRELGVGAEAGSSPDALRTLLDEAYSADLSATSALVQSAPALQRLLGISPATLAWEALLQSEEGSLLALGAGEVDLEELGEDLERLDFERPEEETGVWEGGFDVLARADPLLSPQLAHVAILADRGLVLTSDDPGYLEEAVAAATGEGRAGMPGVEEAAEALVVDGEDPLAASVLTGAHACAALAMAQADDASRAEAEALLEAAGEVSPIAAIGTGLLAGDDARVAMSFETDEQARTNADTRAQLASGPAPGQGGSFTDRFELESATAEGRTLVLDLDPGESTFLLSDLSSGPVLYATC